LRAVRRGNPEVFDGATQLFVLAGLPRRFTPRSDEVWFYLRSSAVNKRFLTRNRFVADAFWFRAFGAELAVDFCGLASADMPLHAKLPALAG